VACRQAKRAKCHDRSTFAHARTGKRDGQHGDFHDGGDKQRAADCQDRADSHAAQDESENQHISYSDQSAENKHPAKVTMTLKKIMAHGRCFYNEGRNGACADPSG
jgi:hypothetical protein